MGASWLFPTPAASFRSHTPGSFITQEGIAQKRWSSGQRGSCSHRSCHVHRGAVPRMSVLVLLSPQDLSGSRFPGKAAPSPYPASSALGAKFSNIAALAPAARSLGKRSPAPVGRSQGHLSCWEQSRYSRLPVPGWPVSALSLEALQGQRLLSWPPQLLKGG